MKLAPIILFVYNRPDLTVEVIKSIKKNRLSKKSNIWIFSDGINKNKKDDYLKVSCVRAIINNLQGFKNVKIIERNNNIGTYKNITLGIDRVFKTEKKAIIIEDDVLVSEFFLEYMNKSLDQYKRDSKIGSICSNIWGLQSLNNKKKLPSTFLLHHSDCWGWATWKKSWKLYSHDSRKLIKAIKYRGLEKKFNLDNAYNYTSLLEQNIKRKRSWAVNWYASLFINNKLNLFSSLIISKNIGLGENSTNTKQIYLSNKIKNKKVDLKKIKIEESKEGTIALINSYNEIQRLTIRPNIFIRILKKLLKLSLKKKIKQLINKKDESFLFSGPYRNWNAALKKSNAYHDKITLKKLLKSAKLVKNKKFAYERDTVLFSTPFFNWRLLLIILKNSSKFNQKLNLIDIGGSLGSSYYQHLPFFHLFKSINWNIVEQDKIVKLGNKYFKDGNLKFNKDLEKTIQKNKPNIILINNCIQYVKDFTKIFEVLKKYKNLTIILDQTLFHNGSKDLILVQHTPKRIYNANYPVHIISKPNFLKNVLSHFRIEESGEAYFPFSFKFDKTNFKAEYLILKT
tara:strand:+ start:3388 stop:5091 length:1704 start_codon:yes stop_codon:yes gene_type:complete